MSRPRQIILVRLSEIGFGVAASAGGDGHRGDRHDVLSEDGNYYCRCGAKRRSRTVTRDLCRL